MYFNGASLKYVMKSRTVGMNSTGCTDSSVMYLKRVSFSALNSNDEYAL